MQNGIIVENICTGIPVSFSNCSNQSATIFYYTGPEAFNPQQFEQEELIKAQENVTFQNPGTYKITQIINTGKVDANGEVITEIFEKEYKVREALPPAFTTITCGNNQVQILITDQNYDTFTIDFGDGTVYTVNQGDQVPHFYLDNQAHIITVEGSYENSSCSATATFNYTPFVNPPAPTITEIRVVEEDPNSGVLELALNNLQAGYSYTIERFTGGPVPFEELASIVPNALGNNSVRIENVNTLTPERYRVLTVDACENPIDFTLPTSSLILEAEQVNNEVQLNWSDISQFPQQYEVYRNGVLLQTLAPDVTSYTDSDFSCNQTYCYTIRLRETNGTSSVSAEKCFTISNTSVPPAGTLYSTFNTANQVELVLEVPQGQEATRVSYHKSRLGAPYAAIATVPQLQFTDANADLNPVCYKAYYANSCGQSSSESSTTCPVILRAAQPNDVSASFAWSGFIGFAEGIRSYTLELLDDNLQVIATIPVTGNTYTENNLNEELQTLRYRIRVTSNNDRVSYSNSIAIEQKLRLYIPSAFTPNGDGLNDLFEVKGETFTAFTIQIYHRSGNLLFSSSDQQQSWDGTHQGKPMPAGAYVYEVNVTLRNGMQKNRRGTVTILR
ncbi:hypothetical protein C1N53_10400 [Pontibacter sp. SGAir0037]|nr:hypothetical protein C1N53_10400 [Pontibacter sp. SGAir0037]